MGYIHHYWVIARSSRVLRQRKRGTERERWVEREEKGGGCQREMEKEENKEVRTENHYRGFAPVKLFTNV